MTYLDRVRLENVFLMFFKSSEIITNKVKRGNTSDSKIELATLGLLEHPFRNIGIHSITEDYFEKDVNSVFCKNGEFIESGQTIGFLNFEKEITGDIVQGLPRIEELLEARKKKRISKYTPKNFKKSLDEIGFLKGVRLNIAVEHDNLSFLKLKIKLRDKIVADGLDALEIDLEKCGKHLDAEEFNLLVEKPITKNIGFILIG